MRKHCVVEVRRDGRRRRRNKNDSSKIRLKFLSETSIFYTSKVNERPTKNFNSIETSERFQANNAHTLDKSLHIHRQTHTHVVPIGDEKCAHGSWFSTTLTHMRIAAIAVPLSQSHHISRLTTCKRCRCIVWVVRIVRLLPFNGVYIPTIHLLCDCFRDRIFFTNVKRTVNIYWNVDTSFQHRSKAIATIFIFSNARVCLSGGRARAREHSAHSHIMACHQMIDLRLNVFYVHILCAVTWKALTRCRLFLLPLPFINEIINHYCDALTSKFKRNVDLFFDFSFSILVSFVCVHQSNQVNSMRIKKIEPKTSFWCA